MSFPAYPAYKESGVKWLPEVPEHWDVRRNKQAFRIVSTLVGSKSKDFQLLSLTLRGVIPRDMESGKGKFPAEFDTYQKVEPGDIVFCLFDIDETPRTVGIASDYGMITGAYTVARAFAGADPRFIYYCYFAIDLRKGLRPFYTGLRKVVRPETFMNIELSLPPRSEQANICNFLDHETARIDALIEEQQRLIELLKEKRQAVISHAVTKGLDPAAPMKDSGVEWLGEVPAHWVVLAIKWRARIKSGDGISPDLIEGQAQEDKPHPVIGGNGVMGFTSQTNVSPPLIVIGRVGALCGNVHKIHVQAWVSDNALILDFDRRSFDISYLVHVLDARNLNEISDKSAQPLITGSKVTSQYIPCPSRHEQLAIARFLEGALSEFDELVLEGVKGIELLKERRSALISAAVTGKIDVRGWQPPTSSPTPESVKEAV